MKKNLLLALCICLLGCQGFAQSLSDKTMTFYGVDFTKARMMGGGFDPVTLPNVIKQWNSIFKVEPDKYDVKSAFKKDNVIYDFTNVEQQNAKIDANAIVSSEKYSLTDADAESVIKNYSANGKSGLGCVFVVESFDKSSATGKMHVIFFDVATNKVILDRKMEEPAGGFGLKNYWAKTIYLTIWDAGKQLPKWIKGK